MKPISNLVLCVLLLALCCLCAWQWHHETALRKLYDKALAEVALLNNERNELETRVKAADGEILRLTAAQAELRANSVSKQLHEEAVTANTTMRGLIEKQNTTITTQNEQLTKAAEAIEQANTTIQKLTTERTSLTTRLNEVTTKYNDLVKKVGQSR
jgi:predicted  nucleic acid-binding Zn-ribbon protein